MFCPPPDGLLGVVKNLSADWEPSLHAVGGIMGFGLVHAGKDGIIWAQRDPGAFPPYKVRTLCMSAH